MKQCGRCHAIARLTMLAGTALCLLAVTGVPSWAGPPFLTDDPEPVEYKHGELYLAGQYAKDKDATSGTAPHVELNFGAAPGLQLHLIAPRVYDRPAGESAHAGYGDTEIGVKYRFANDEGSRFMAATFPLVELPSGDSDKGLGAGHTRFFIPLWLQKSWGAWQTYGGGGYWRNPGAGNKDYWFLGWEAQRAVSETLTFGAELFEQTRDREGARDRFGFNAGAVLNFTDDHHLLVSAGRDISGNNRFSAYLAYQYTFGPMEGK
jgi:hypothetical protein